MKLFLNSRKPYNLMFIPALIMFVYLLFNTKLILSPFMPFDDTFRCFEYFHFTYQEYFNNGTIPQWIPYFQYGTPIDILNIIHNSPFTLLAVVLGGALGISDSWFPFLGVLFTETAIMVVGVALVLHALKLRYAAILIASSSLVFTCIVITNLWTHTRPLYLVPLAFYYLHTSFEKKQFYRTVLGCLLLLFNTVGMPPYWIPVYLLLLIIILVVLILYNFSALKWRPKFDLRNCLTVLLTAVFLWSYGYFLFKSRDFLSFNAPLRDPETLKVSLDTFLNYGGNSLGNFFEVFLGVPVGSVRWVDFYLTIPGLFFLMYGLIRGTGVGAVSFKILFLIFLALSLGKYTPLAYLAYYLPLMPLFRHLVALYSITKLFAVLLVACGYEQFMEESDKNKMVFANMIMAIMVIIFALSSYFYRYSLFYNKSFLTLYLVALAGYPALYVLIRKRNKYLPVTLFILMTFQSFFYYDWYTNSNHSYENRVHVPITDELNKVQTLRFEEHRLPNEYIWQYPGNNWRSLIYKDSSFDFVLFDTEVAKIAANVDLCVPFISRVNFVMKNVKDMYDQLQYPRQNNIDYWSLTTFKEPMLDYWTGCGAANKIQLFTNYTEQKAVRAIGPKELAKGDMYLKDLSLVIVQDKNEVAKTKSLEEQGIKITQFSNNSQKMVVNTPRDSWLYYADAFHPDWKGYLDGVPTKIYEANYAFKAMFIPAGNHIIEFNFNKRWIFLAYCTFNITACLTVILLIGSCIVKLWKNITGN